jgi:hypothetical protein
MSASFDLDSQAVEFDMPLNLSDGAGHASMGRIPMARTEVILVSFDMVVGTTESD